MSNHHIRYSITHRGERVGHYHDRIGFAVKDAVDFLAKVASNPEYNPDESVVLWEHRRPRGQKKEVVEQLCVITL